MPVTEDSIGTYYCHAEVAGYKTINSRPAEVLMTGKTLKYLYIYAKEYFSSRSNIFTFIATICFAGPPKIFSSPAQSGVVGENVHINCAAVTVPQPDNIVWRHHQATINEGNIKIF